MPLFVSTRPGPQQCVTVYYVHPTPATCRLPIRLRLLRSRIEPSALQLSANAWGLTQLDYRGVAVCAWHVWTQRPDYSPEDLCVDLPLGAILPVSTYR